MPDNNLYDNIKSIQQMEQIASDLRQHNKIIVTTNGSYDIIHSAHINLLKKAKDLGHILIVLLNSDESIRRNKGPKRPIIHENDRANHLAGLKPVDYVVIFPQDKPLEYLERIKGHYHVKGGSWDPIRMTEEKDFVRQWGCKYQTFDLEQGISSSEIIKRVLDLYKD